MLSSFSVVHRSMPQPRFGVHHPSVSSELEKLAGRQYAKATPDDAKSLVTATQKTALELKVQKEAHQCDKGCYHACVYPNDINDQALVELKTKELLLMTAQAPIATVKALNVAITDSEWEAPEALSRAILARLQA